MAGQQHKGPILSLGKLTENGGQSLSRVLFAGLAQTSVRTSWCGAASFPHKVARCRNGRRSLSKRAHPYQICQSCSKSSKSKNQSLQKPVMKVTSSDFCVLEPIHIWLYLGAKLSRSLQGQEMTLNKNSLGSLSRRRGSKAVGWFTPNGSSKTPIPIFVPIWRQCAKQAQSKLSVSKSSCQRILYGNQKDLVCRSPLL